MACLDLAEFPLQLLLEQQPEWAKHPVVVVDRDQPQGKVLWTNEHARRQRIQAGMRYASALSLARNLRAAEVSSDRIGKRISEIRTRLLRFSPKVESSDEEIGVFWIDASGLERLYVSLEAWGREIQENLSQAGFKSGLVIGFTRFGTYALARSMPPGIVVLRSPVQEKQATSVVPLETLDLDPKERVLLDRLGIRTVGSLLDLPASGLRKRFGPEVFRLHQWASGNLWTPLRPQPNETVRSERLLFDDAETDLHRLLFRIKELTDLLLVPLEALGEALVALEIRLLMEGKARGPRKGSHSAQGEIHRETIRTARPTREIRQILNLVHLRLERVDLRAGVVEIEVELRSVRVIPEQLGLFAECTSRDRLAGDRALARLRAEFGEETVVRARLVERHLPEARFRWERLERMVRPQPGPDAKRSLVRRFLNRRQRLPPAAPVDSLSRRRREPDGWLLLGPAGGRVVELDGPDVISGGWWARPVHREYHFAELRRGRLLWIFYDRSRRVWVLHGEVE